jgi:ABC-type oligopeptide transport system ATPase subunit
MTHLESLVQINNLSKEFSVEKGLFRHADSVHAVNNVSFSIEQGEIVALVGESGSGKSTIGKMIQGLIEPSQGEILLNGRNAASFSRKEHAHFVQMIFQDPFASLNPKLSVGTMLREAIEQELSMHPADYPADRSLKEIMESLLHSVGLHANILLDYPHQFSGGQRQRLGIARALAMKPKLIVADEPVSALDLSIQAQILNLLMDLNDSLEISYLLITHDLSVVQQVADRVLVIHDGQIIEQGPVEEIFQKPKETYTQKLLSAIPILTFT